MLQRYIEQSPDMKPVRIFSDNGLTGTNFDRPGFEALLDAIRRGEVNCVVVKDLSRFGRDYIEAGNYIETVFPSLGVRFISINDSFDSSDPLCWSDGMSIALKNIINAAYAKDISVKMRTAYDAKRRRGDFTGATTPFGYTRLPEKKSRLVVDPESAEIVRDIFRWRIEGASLSGIAARLNAAGVPNPSHYSYLKGYRNDKRFAEPIPWDISVIAAILRNVAYIGHLELGKKIAVSMGNSVKQPKENWIFTRDAHESIISQADFDAVAEIARQSKERRRAAIERNVKPALPDNIFKGLAFCGVCGHTFNRDSVVNANGERVIYYHCTTCKKRGNGGKGKRLSLDKLKTVVYEAVTAHVRACADAYAIAERVRKSDPVTRRTEENLKELDAAKKRIAYIDSHAERLLSDHYDGLLSGEDYRLISKQREDERRALTIKTESLLASIERYRPGTGNSPRSVDVFERLDNQSELTRDMLDALVERVEVDGNMNVIIKPRYRDEFVELKRFIDENGGAEQ
jgi:DNA invertase Pin-like site-specific DNA recombinase